MPTEGERKTRLDGPDIYKYIYFGGGGEGLHIVSSIHLKG